MPHCDRFSSYRMRGVVSSSKAAASQGVEGFVSDALL
jgi:hypothetical protein